MTSPTKKAAITKNTPPSITICPTSTDILTDLRSHVLREEARDYPVTRRVKSGYHSQELARRRSRKYTALRDSNRHSIAYQQATLDRIARPDHHASRRAPRNASQGALITSGDGPRG